MTQPSLPDKVLAIARGLGDVPHAFGGALALAYHAEPRATVDIDVNVFVTVDRADEALAPLSALGIEVDLATAAEAARADGQVRLMWGHNPVDLFFAYDRFHDAADAGAVEVPFAGHTIRVLSATHLAVCKAVFDRPRDWVDIEAMLELGTAVDIAEALRWVGRIAGDEDPRYERLAALLGRS